MAISSIFNSYVSLPEGIFKSLGITRGNPVDQASSTNPLPFFSKGDLNSAPCRARNCNVWWTRMTTSALHVDLAARGSRTSGAWDWNKICAYHTNRVVRIQDANLGLVTSADGEGIVKIPMGYARDAINWAQGPNRWHVLNEHVVHENWGEHLQENEMLSLG